MNIFSYYCSQSKTTYPGPYQYLFNELPDDVANLCEIIQGLILHYADADLFHYSIPNERYKEMDTRYVKKILDTILKLNSSSLSQNRIAAQRMVGVCRDNSVLLCSILRSKKIPARLRAGFINYIMPNFNLDHMCVEYWNASKQKWCFVDPRTSLIHIEKYQLNIDFDLYDLPLNRFIPAAQAWQQCRLNQVNPNRFGSRKHRGLWYVKNRVLQDIAVINKQEVLIWDLWGKMLTEKNGTPVVLSPDLIILDKLSEFISKQAYNLDAFQEYYKNNTFLNIPTLLHIFNPFTEPTIEQVDI